MYVPQILMCLFLSMFLEVMLLSNIIFTYLLMGLMFCLIFILKTSMMVSNMKKHSPQIKIARVILIIRLLSYHQDVKKFGKNDLIELSGDISTKDDKKHGVVKYMIDSQDICP